jgi:3'-phosphoadenosine 5'-phosphosulfate sulfotransferase (PAPS reductase)/FAD synthetase
MKCPNCGNEAPPEKTYCSRGCANKYRRVKERAERTTYTVWSCGGGVQSTAIAALIYTGKIDKPDYAVMVDTGYEKSCVMDYVRGTLIPKMAEVDLALNIIRTSDYAEQSIIDKDGYCIIPAFKRTGSDTQKLRTCCNQHWKVGVIRKWLLSVGVEQYISLIGISTD